MDVKEGLRKVQHRLDYFWEGSVTHYQFAAPEVCVLSTSCLLVLIYTSGQSVLQAKLAALSLSPASTLLHPTGDIHSAASDPKPSLSESVLPLFSMPTTLPSRPDFGFMDFGEPLFSNDKEYPLSSSPVSSLSSHFWQQ